MELEPSAVTVTDKRLLWKMAADANRSNAVLSIGFDDVVECGRATSGNPSIRIIPEADHQRSTVDFYFMPSQTELMDLIEGLAFRGVWGHKVGLVVGNAPGCLEGIMKDEVLGPTVEFGEHGWVVRDEDVPHRMFSYLDLAWFSVSIIGPAVHPETFSDAGEKIVT